MIVYHGTTEWKKTGKNIECYLLKKKMKSGWNLFVLVEPIPMREAVINAIVHSDFSREIPPVFEIFSDRMVFTSYGDRLNKLFLL